MKIWITRVILLLAIIFWMSSIFGFSAETGEESSSLSDKIANKIVHIIEKDYDSMDPVKQQELFDTVSFTVRKIGHFGEYGILGILVAGFAMTFELIRENKKYIVIIPTVICLIYAATDEFHQGFVDGRSPKIMDVGIDTAGGMVAGIGMLIIYCLVKRSKHESLAEEH